MADLILKAGLAGKSQQQLIINTPGRNRIRNVKASYVIPNKSVRQIWSHLVLQLK